MTITEAIRQRKSIRGYKPDSIPKEILREILEIATRSPSGGNVQPWEITVVTGKTLEDIKQGNVEKLSSGAMVNPDVVMKPVEGVYKQRWGDNMGQLLGLLGIAREDKEKRAEFAQKGMRFYDAPVAIILSADRSLYESRTQMDLGLITQTICLTALEYGLGTCIQLATVIYPEVIRKSVPIPDSQRITVSIAIGYPDWDFPANKDESNREPLDGITNWFGFD